MIRWLTDHWPANQAQAIFKGFISTIAESLKTDSHKAQDIFFSNHQATSTENQEKKKSRKAKAKDNFWIKVPWRNPELKDFALPTILNTKEIQDLYPSQEEIEKIKISYNLAPPIGISLMNYALTSKDPCLDSAEEPRINEHTTCPCQAFKSEHSLELDGHVVTTDPSFIKDSRLKSLWLKGRKHRVQAHPASTLQGLEAGLNTFIKQACARCKTTPDSFDAWKNAILSTMQAKFEIAWNLPNTDSNPFLPKKGHAEIQEIHKNMVVLCVDKSAQDLALCCKNIYLNKLWKEIHSDHYEDCSMADKAEIWERHADLSSRQVNTEVINDNCYLYGSLKMHKEKIGFRWIAGNHMNKVLERSDKMFPSCSLSGAESAMGGVLRMCMKILEAKDKACRKQGYKRYWITTNVDVVADSIKNNAEKLRGLPVFTRDFTRMYTSIPQENLANKVISAMHEAFTWKALDTKTPFANLRADVTYDFNGHAEAEFKAEGLAFDELSELLKSICTEVYFQQDKDSRIYRQSGGLPMGGKASAEIANLYCYTIESQYIDKLIAANKIKEARDWLNTWRYIDDMKGFGSRPWDEIDYGMSHLDTTDRPYDPLTQTSESVFLGMRTISHPSGIQLSVEPKGKGWRWIPQRFIEFSSCHTHYTREHMFLSLLIRATTLSNSSDNFFKAATEYAQGLIARGFNAAALKKSWRKFCYSRSNDPILRKDLTKRFFAWLEQQDFSKAVPESSELRKQNTAKRTQAKLQELLCGYDAFNAILKVLGKSPVERDFMDTAAKDLAQQEAELLYDTSAKNVSDLYHDPRGHYAADVLHHAIHTRTGLPWNQWDGREPSVNPETLAKIFLIGFGDHWTVAVKDCNGHWVHRDGSGTTPIVLLHKFLSMKSKSGAVYYFGDLDTKTIHDRVSTLRPQKRDRPANTPAKANENPREEGKTPAPTKQKNNPPTPVTTVPPPPGPFPFVPGDKAFQVLSPTNDDPTPPICSGHGNDMPTQQFNNVAEANQATFVPDNALQSANPGWTYKDAPLGGKIPPSVTPVGPRPQLPAPDSPTQELSQGPSSAMNLLMGLVSPVLQALTPSRHVHPERSLSYTPTPDSPPRRSKRTSQPPEHFDTSAVQEAEKQARARLVGVHQG